MILDSKIEILSQSGSLDVDITSIVFDSRAVCAGSLFFALPGTHTTGNVFISDAILRGAAAVIFEGEIDSKDESKIRAVLCEQKKDVPLIRVPNARYAMAPISAAFFENPSHSLAVIGVTGTEGKSSTVSFVWQFLKLLGHKAGFISTVQYSTGGEAQSNPEHTTTPEAPVIQARLREMVENGCEFAVLETSSHGLSKKLNRTGNIEFDCGIFMNVTLEHLEFHGTFEQYRDDKANLFRKLDECSHEKSICGTKKIVPSFGIVNLEDESAPYFIQATKQSVLGFTTEGRAGRSAAEGTDAAPLPPLPRGVPFVLARNIATARFGLTFDMTEPNAIDEHARPLPKKVIRVKSSVSGAFNAYNIMAAILAVSRLTGTSPEEIAPLSEKLVPVKGRMTTIDNGQPFELIVDYAHTPSSFETIFPPIRRRCSGKMICVFGSGGERDTEKRPLQGKIAARFCDTVILSNEDPRNEDEMKILEDIAVGARLEGKKDGEDLFLIPDRTKAIRAALSRAKNDDIVLLLGKSHENSIISKDGAHPYDEIREAESALCELGYNG